MEIKYETINRSRYKKHPFLISDFNEDKKNKIMSGLIERIKEEEKERGIVVNPIMVLNPKNGKEYLKKIQFESMDGVLNGVISHRESGAYFEVNGSINAFIEFNSTSKKDQPSYAKLYDILSDLKFTSAI